jgi:hypothetical protein
MLFHHHQFLYKFESDLPWGEPIGVVTMKPIKVGADSTSSNSRKSIKER